jgi:hypothetical protein
MLSIRLRDVRPGTIHKILHLLHPKEVRNHEATKLEDRKKAQICDLLGLLPARLLLLKLGFPRLLQTIPRLLHTLDLNHRIARVHPRSYSSHRQLPDLYVYTLYVLSLNPYPKADAEEGSKDLGRRKWRHTSDQRWQQRWKNYDIELQAQLS